MKRFVIYGNSGAGKTTMATKISREQDLVHLDLDVLAWKSPGVREQVKISLDKLYEFVENNKDWVVEGCYGSLIENLFPFCTELRFLNPGLDLCLENTLNRPWEPHKYDTSSLQNEHFEKLKVWVAEYETRSDEFSLTYHENIFRAFKGVKREYRSLNEYEEHA